MATSVVGALPSLACRFGVDNNEADRQNREFGRMIYQDWRGGITELAGLKYRNIKGIRRVRSFYCVSHATMNPIRCKVVGGTSQARRATGGV